jgi:hypothetical protein
LHTTWKHLNLTQKSILFSMSSQCTTYTSSFSLLKQQLLLYYYQKKCFQRNITTVPYIGVKFLDLYQFDQFSFQFHTVKKQRISISVQYLTFMTCQLITSVSQYFAYTLPQYVYTIWEYLQNMVEYAHYDATARNFAETLICNWNITIRKFHGQNV